MAIVIGDNDFYQLQYTGAQLEAFLAKIDVLDKAKAYLPYYGTTGNYTSFFRFNSTGTSSTHCQILVGGVGRAAGTNVGLYLLDVRVTSGTINTVTGTIIEAPSNTCTFGY